MPPRRATPRTPGRETDGHLGGFVGHVLGRPWKPHQRLVADIAGELLPSGRYAYPIGVVLFPRQVGKTTTVMDLAIGRCLHYPDYRAAYTAQTGHVSSQRFSDVFTEFERSPLASRIRCYRARGLERITVPSTGSYLMAFPPKDGALRGSALDLVVADEAQEHDDRLGTALDQAILPTFTTRPRRQLILVGTAGTDRSAYLRRYLNQAREAVPGFFVIEYGAPDTAGEITDRVLLETHPGLASGLTDLDALRTAQAALGPAGFAREYGNVWARTSIRLFDPADWEAVQTSPDTPRPAGPWCLGVDITPDRSAAAIAAATPTGHVELVEYRPGTDWTLDRLRELQAAHRAPIACDRYGATAPLFDALELAGADLVPLAAADVTIAAAGMLDAIRDRTLAVYPSEVLTAAIDGAVKRPIGDSGGFAWSRAHSSAVVAPLVAASHALWGARHSPPPVKPAAYAQ